MTFTAIDFETAYAQFPCEIGICQVENGIIQSTRSWLIKPACFPYMNRWNFKTHGISSEMLKDELSFGELWSTLKPLLDDTLLVAHNASFDMGVLRSSLKWYDLAMPHSEYVCSVSLSRRVWKGLTSYSLNNLCDLHDIHFHHHRAGSDAEACARLVLKMNESVAADSMEDLIRAVQLIPHVLSAD
ncbi:MAG: 3'-5' exonuclease [Microbacter sp.]